jgi:serine/threonine-protein kinase
MEFISGCNLETLLRRGGPLEVKEILRIGIQVACGLAAAHKQGLIHCDIKPGNVLLDNGGTAWVGVAGTSQFFQKIGADCSRNVVNFTCAAE